MKSQRGVEFCRWATNVLKRYIMQGHVENDERLQQLGAIVQIIERLPGSWFRVRSLISWRAIRALTSYLTSTIARRCHARRAHVQPMSSTTTNAWRLSDKCFRALRVTSSGARKTTPSVAASPPSTSRLVAGALSLARGEGCEPAVLHHQEPFVRRRQ